MADANERNMKTLKNEDQVRQRPGVIFGTNNEQGAFHGIFEVVANSIDEAREGHGDKIVITVEQGEVITVEDDGRGLPMDWNADEGKYNWELALCTLYASGKYDDAQYSQSLGLNGLGLTAMQYASEFMEVWSTYGGKTRYMSFERGVPKLKQMVVTDAIREGTGTKIRFKADDTVFPALKTTRITPEVFVMALRKQAMLLPGLAIVFQHYELSQPITFLYKRGAVDYIDSVVERRMLAKTVEFSDSATGTDNEELYPEPYTVHMKLAFNFSRDGNTTEIYHNASHMWEGGKTVEGFERGITSAFTDYARMQGKLGRSDRFVYKDIDDILVCVASSDSPGNRSWFKNQTKGAVTNPFLGSAMAQFIYNKFRFWLDNNANEASRVLAEVLANKKAREEGAEVSKKVIKSLSSQVSFSNKPKDFNDCSSKVISERELYVVEGRSALGSVKQARNPKTQGIIPVRGKPINCLKERITRVLKNDIIIDLFRVMGCGMEVKSEYIEDIPKFDITKLKWGKVIICTDADDDGFHIRTLLLTMIFILAPSLIKYGKVYIAESPLFEITWKKETRFAFSIKEKDDIIAELVNMGAREEQIRIQRSKGLGENDPKMMSVSTMNPLTRRLIPVEYPKDEATFRSIFNALLGDDLEGRRTLIDEYFDRVDMA